MGSKKPKKLTPGYSLGNKSSDQYMSPKRPYTGDGKTRRSFLDKIVVVFKKGGPS